MESAKLSALLVLATLALSSSAPLALAREMVQPECNSCQTGTPSAGTPAGGITLPPVTLPPVSVPKLPSLPVPSVPLPSLPLPPVTGIPPVVGGVAPVVGGVAGGLPPAVGGVVGGVAPVVGGVVGGVTPVVGGVVGGVTPVVGGVVGGVTPVVGGVVGGVTPIIGGGSPKHSSPKARHGGRKACPPPPSPTPSPPSDTCPIDALKLGACVDLLGNEVHIGDAHVQCCPLVKGVAGLSAAACLCTAIKAKVLDLSVYVPIALKLLVNCGCAVPPGYNCA